MPPVPSPGQTLGGAGPIRPLPQCPACALHQHVGSWLCLFLLGPQDRRFGDAEAGSGRAPLGFGVHSGAGSTGGWTLWSPHLPTAPTRPSRTWHPLHHPPTPHSALDASPGGPRAAHPGTGLGDAWAWRAGRGHGPLVWFTGLACVLRAWATSVSSPALGPAACPHGQCPFCRRGDILTAQPLPAGQGLQPGRGAPGRDAEEPQTGPRRQTHLLLALHLCACPSLQGAGGLGPGAGLMDCAHWGAPQSLAYTVPHRPREGAPGERRRRGPGEH